jgi:hypothetical protein
MEESDEQSKTIAVIVVLEELRHRVDVFRISKHVQLFDEDVVIELYQFVEMIRSEFSSCARTEKVVLKIKIKNKTNKLPQFESEKFNSKIQVFHNKAVTYREKQFSCWKALRPI